VLYCFCHTAFEIWITILKKKLLETYGRIIMKFEEGKGKGQPITGHEGPTGGVEV
jgi:hypothetical protein